MFLSWMQRTRIEDNKELEKKDKEDVTHNVSVNFIWQPVPLSKYWPKDAKIHGLKNR